MIEQKNRAKLPLYEHAYAVLKKRIEEERFAAGEVFSEQKLAEELGMSRTPVRRAIHRLEQEGLLSVAPRKGAFINKLSIQEYRDVNDLRSVLEPLALETSICRIPQDILAEQENLWTCIAREIENKREIDRSRLVKLDAEFHAIIVKYCGNKRLKGVMDIIQHQVDQIRLFSWMNSGFFSRSIEEHIRLVKLIKAKKLCAARDLLKRHILLKDKYIESVIGK